MGFAQSRILAAGYELGLESEMDPESVEVGYRALEEFEGRWPRDGYEPDRYRKAGYIS